MNATILLVLCGRTLLARVLVEAKAAIGVVLRQPVMS